MIVKNINNRINPTIILSNNRVTNVQSQSTNPKNSNSLQKQLSFMGIANLPIIKSVLKRTKPQNTSILDKYFEKLNRFDIPDATILHKNEGATNIQLMILDTPAVFGDALAILRKNINNHAKDPLFKLYLHDEFFDDYLKISQDIPELQTTFIKGIAGQGLSSTAFLTADDEIIKLSFFPLFPSKKHFAQGVEIPIISRYKEMLPDDTIIYGVKEKFAEMALIRDMSLEEYNKIWDKLNDKLKKINPKFDFCDFKRDDIDYRIQLGFIDDTPYLIDHECIDGRHLME